MIFWWQMHRGPPNFIIFLIIQSLNKKRPTSPQLNGHLNPNVNKYGPHGSFFILWIPFNEPYLILEITLDNKNRNLCRSYPVRV